MIYLDHAATTPLDKRLMPLLEEMLALPLNPSSVHRAGQKARAQLEEARSDLAAMLDLPPDQVLFTSGATEANNLALRGLAAQALRQTRPLTVLSSQLEHSCVRETIDDLARGGRVAAEMLPVEPNGQVRLPTAEHAPRPLDIICVMAANNETGVVQPMETAAQLRTETGALWLCDVTQAIPALVEDIRRNRPDLISFSSHKLHGPPGAGALAGPALSRLAPLITGGPQEEGRRAGTQPVALIRAFVEALRLALAEADIRAHHLRSLEAAFIGRLGERQVDFHLNGDGAPRLPGFINISFDGFTGADLVIALDVRGFAVSSGAACATGVMEASATMTAMFPRDPARAAGALRITPGTGTTSMDMIALADALADIASTGR